MTLIDYLNQPGRTQLELARALGVSQGLIGQWLSGRSRITAERAREIERATGGQVTRHELRPDVFDPPAVSTESAA